MSAQIPQITVQLYSLREEAGKDYEAMIRRVADIGFRNVEPAGYPGTTPEQAAALLKELGLSAPSCHGALPVGDNKQQVIETAQLMGHKYIITGCPPKFSEDFASHDSIKKLAELYCEAADYAAQFGIQVGYHNHDWDLCEIDGKRGYKTFLENTPDTVLWEADLFWVTKAGLVPADFVQEIGVRGKCLHFKDGVINDSDEYVEAETEDGKIMVSNAKPFMPAGTGVVKLEDASKVATHAEYIAVELDAYEGDMFSAVEQSYKWLTSKGIAQGAK